MLYYVNKTLRELGEGVFVNDPGISKIKELLGKKAQVVLMPVYKSFLDFPVLVYSLLVNQIELPFTIGNSEDIPEVKLVDTFLKRFGYLPTKRSRNQSFQQSYINQAVLRELLNGQPLTIMFQNDIRLRSGKFNQPVIPDMSVMWLLQAYLTSR